jgi:hypothetical protein
MQLSRILAGDIFPGALIHLFNSLEAHNSTSHGC